LPWVERSAALAYAANNAGNFDSWRVPIDENAYNASYTGAVYQGYISKSTSVVPEPSTYALMATGLGRWAWRRAAAGGAGRARSPGAFARVFGGVGGGGPGPPPPPGGAAPTASGGTAPDGAAPGGGAWAATGIRDPWRRVGVAWRPPQCGAGAAGLG
jgi:hypothetical protein